MFQSEIKAIDTAPVHTRQCGGMEQFEFVIFACVFVIQHSGTYTHAQRTSDVPHFVAAFVYFKSKEVDPQALNNAFESNFNVTLEDARTKYHRQFSGFRRVSVVGFKATDENSSNILDLNSIRHGAKGLWLVMLQALCLVSTFLRCALAFLETSGVVQKLRNGKKRVGG